MIKLNKFFKHSIRNEISELTNGILNEKWQKEISKAKIESFGILDGRELIFEFLDHNENRCAYEHLAYIISELEISLTNHQIMKMDKLVEKLNIK